MTLDTVPLLQGGVYVIELLDKYATAFPLLTIALFETLVVSWVYGMGTHTRIHTRTCMKTFAIFVSIRVVVAWVCDKRAT